MSDTVALYSVVVFVTGLVFGALLAFCFRSTVAEAQRQKHQETTIMQGKEIARLRAHVAKIIDRPVREAVELLEKSK